MPADPIIDIERLLAPISDEQPTGEALSLSDFDGPLMRCKDAWDEARKLVREQEEKERFGGVDANGQPWRTIPHPDWDGLLEIARDALENKSKDLRIAAWLAESLLREHHLRGLVEGLEVCSGLCDRYWDSLHPAANEEDGHGVAMSAFAALVSDSSFSAVFETPIAYGQKQNEREPRSYSAHDYLQARELETADSEERERRLSEGQAETADILALLEITPREFHTENLELIDQAISTLSKLGDFFRENCRDDEYGEPTAPGISSFREQLESLRRLVSELAGDEVASSDEENENESGGASGGSPVSQKQQMTRETAFKSIESIAQFFEKTEPHSPVHFALRQVVRWGRMPLHELLAELIDDSTVMGALRRQIGLPPEESE